MMDEQINKAVARVILSTKRKSRQYSLYEIAKDIDFLKNAKGNMSEVVKLIGISAGMLNQFLSVFKLPETIINYVKERKIDSVSIVHHLAKFKSDDAIKLADLIIKDGLSSQDLRVILPFRKQFPNENIIDLVERVLKSKNIKVSVIKFPQGDLQRKPEALKEEIISLVGSENFVEINTEGSIFNIKIKKNGEKILRQTARNRNQTLQELITTFLR